MDRQVVLGREPNRHHGARSHKEVAVRLFDGDGGRRVGYGGYLPAGVAAAGQTLGIGQLEPVGTRLLDPQLPSPGSGQREPAAAVTYTARNLLTVQMQYGRSQRLCRLAGDPHFRANQRADVPVGLLRRPAGVSRRNQLDGKRLDHHRLDHFDVDPRHGIVVAPFDAVSERADDVFALYDHRVAHRVYRLGFLGFSPVGVLDAIVDADLRRELRAFGVEHLDLKRLPACYPADRLGQCQVRLLRPGSCP